MSAARPSRRQAPTLTLVRRALLGIFLLGTVGIGAELLLIGHTEDAWQWVPIVLLGASLLLLGWHAVAPGPRSLRTFQGFMLVFIGSGVLGAILHYRGNAEFEREMVPTISGWALFRESMTGATPALAPGTMLWLGLVGLAWTFRHPRRLPSGESDSSPTE